MLGRLCGGHLASVDLDPAVAAAGAGRGAVRRGDASRSLRLKLLVDWQRYRLTWAWARALADHAEATTGLSQVEAEPSPSEAYVEMAAGRARSRGSRLSPPGRSRRMRSRVWPTRGWPSCAGVPPPTKYPALPRLWELTAEALAGADEVTYAGASRLTLLFVGERLAGVVEAP